MGLNLRFFPRPYPLGGRVDIADDRLPALGNVDVLYDHALFALRAIFLQSRHLRGERPGELVEGVLGTVLLRDVVDVGEASGEGHRRVVDGGHLCGEHRLDLIARRDPLVNMADLPAPLNPQPLPFETVL